MSVLLQQNRRGLFVADGVDAPDRIKNGIPYGLSGAVAVDYTSDIDHYHQGLPFTAAGRLATEQANPVRFNSGAMPLSANDRLCIFLNIATNLYPNAEFAGGGVNTACDLHAFPFLSNGADFVPDVNRPTFNQLFSNTQNVSGRSALQLDVDANTTLTVGTTYRIQYRVKNLNSDNYNVALGAFNVSDVTLGDNLTQSAPDTTRFLFQDFTPTSPAWALNVRVGCGTTANNTTQMRIDFPFLYDTTTSADNVVVSYNGGVGYNTSGAIVAITNTGENTNFVYGYLQTTSLKGTGWLSQRRTSTNTDAMWVNEAETARSPVTFSANADGTYTMYAYDRTGAELFVAQRGDEAQSSGSNGWYYFVDQQGATPDKIVKWTPDFAAPFTQVDDESGLTARSELFNPNEWVRWSAGGGTDDITFEWIANPDNLRDWLIGNIGDLYGYSRNTGMGAMRNRVVGDELIFRLQVDNLTNDIEMRMENNAQVGTTATFTVTGNGVSVVVIWNNGAYFANDAAFTAMVVAANGALVPVSII